MAQAELIDPHPDIHALFVYYNTTLFHSALDAVSVSWSSRMTRCAGLCYYSTGTRECRIRLSEPLLQFRSRQDIIDTLLHEMIHAYLFVTNQNTDHDDHGPKFMLWAYMINKKEGSRISIYHTFQDEVEYFQKHWWQCNRCGKIIKRAMNRAPSSNDRWWSTHVRRCGGEWIKIREPEKTTKPKNKKKQNSKNKKKSLRHPSQQHKIESFLKNQSSTNSASSPTLSSTSDSLRKQPKNIDEHQSQNIDLFQDDIDKALQQNSLSERIECPSCQQLVPFEQINAHLDHCVLQISPTIPESSSSQPSSSSHAAVGIKRTNNSVSRINQINHDAEQPPKKRRKKEDNDVECIIISDDDNDDNNINNNNNNNNDNNKTLTNQERNCSENSDLMFNIYPDIEERQDMIESFMFHKPNSSSSFINAFDHDKSKTPSNNNNSFADCKKNQIPSKISNVKQEKQHFDSLKELQQHLVASIPHHETSLNFGYNAERCSNNDESRVSLIMEKSIQQRRYKQQKQKQFEQQQQQQNYKEESNSQEQNTISVEQLEDDVKNDKESFYDDNNDVNYITLMEDIERNHLVDKQSNTSSNSNNDRTPSGSRLNPVPVDQEWQSSSTSIQGMNTLQFHENRERTQKTNVTSSVSTNNNNNNNNKNNLDNNNNNKTNNNINNISSQNPFVQYPSHHSSHHPDLHDNGGYLDNNNNFPIESDKQRFSNIQPSIPNNSSAIQSVPSPSSASLTKAASSSSKVRECPICCATFPSHTTEDIIEKHVAQCVAACDFGDEDFM